MRYKDIIRVLNTIRPGAEWNLRGDSYDDIEWLDKKQAKPTEEEVSAKLVALPDLSYQDKRRSEYPSLGDQLDALWKGGQAALDMKDTIDAIKEKYPK